MVDSYGKTLEFEKKTKALIRVWAGRGTRDGVGRVNSHWKLLIIFNG
jgi:hypothetical protein